MAEYASIPVVAIPLIIAVAIFAATRGICYFAGNLRTDNEKVVRMATEIGFLRWPSRMHSLPYGRGQLREYWVLGLKLLMKVTRMKPSDHLNVTLALAANAVSAVAIFFIARHYFGDLAGLFGFSLYVTCVWPYHVAVYMGHVLLSQALFLLSVLALIMTGSVAGAELPLYLVAGILIGMSFSSSSSSRKYPLLFLAALVFESKDFFVLPHQSGFDIGRFADTGALLAFGIPTAALLGVIGLRRQIAAAVVPMTGKRRGRRWSAERLSEVTSLAANRIPGYLAWGIGLCGVLYVLQPEGRFYVNASVCFAGLALVAVHVLSPNFVANILHYRDWMDQTNWVSHFVVWNTHHGEVFGKQLPHNFRGGGISWTPRFLVRMAPVIVVAYLGALLILVGDTTQRVHSGEVGTIHGALTLCAIVFVSLIPIIVSELSKSLQLGKAYYPALAGLLILITAGASAIVDIAEGIRWAQSLLILGAGALLIWQASITFRALATDQIPARMGPAHLYKFLKNNGISSFSTYQNPYNAGLVESMLYSHPGEFEVTYIDSIEDAGGGIVVVPPTSSKSVEMESDRYGVENGDFRADPLLTRLLDTKEIEQIALAKVNTRGSSRYFVHESEVTTYRAIFLNQVTDHDRWLAHGWVVDTQRLAATPDKTRFVPAEAEAVGAQSA